MGRRRGICGIFGHRRVGSAAAAAAARWVLSASLLMTFVGFSALGNARAQDGAKQGYVPRVRPDVQIVVLPLPTGEWGISAVYPGRVPHADSERRLKQLVNQTGWKANHVEYLDSSLDLARRDGKKIDRTKSEDESAPDDPVMSEVTFATPANVVDFAGGVIDVSPFALAFEDLSRVNVVFFIPAKFQFRFGGLRHFDDSHLTIDMASGQGTYTYLLNIKDHRMAKLDLPKFQPVVSTTESPRVSALRARARTIQTVLVIALAGIVGCLVYIWATRLVGGNSSSSRG